MALTEPFYCTLFCGSPMPTLLQVHPPQIVPVWLCPLFPIRTLSSHHSLSPNKHLFLSSCPLILLLPHPMPRSFILLALACTISLPVLSKSYPFFQAQHHPTPLPSRSGAQEALWGAWVLEGYFSSVCLTEAPGVGEGLLKILISELTLGEGGSLQHLTCRLETLFTPPLRETLSK